MALTLVRTNAQTKWLILWSFDVLKMQWNQITYYPVPFEVDDTRFQKNVILAVEQGLVFYLKGHKPGKQTPFKIDRKIIDQIVSNPPIFQESLKVDFDSYWRQKQQLETIERLKVPNELRAKYQDAYNRGDRLPERILKLFPKRD